MTSNIEHLDWSLVQAFLAVAEAGSLSAAARQLGASQPTLGRQIKAAEAQLGLSLLRRHPKGYELTQAGAALVEPARRMREAMRDIAMFAAGRETGLNGTVRITASEMVCHHVLPPIIADMRTAHPDIDVELVPSDATENLLYREADIALRMYRPTQLEVVARYLGDVRMGLFAAKRYVAQRGMPDSMAALKDHDIIGYDRSDLIVLGMRQAGIEITREDFPVRCDNQPVYWELVRAGCGIGFGQVIAARRDPEMIEIDLGVPVPSLPVWLAAHEGLRQTPRVRRVWDMLVDGMGAVLE